MRSDPELEEMIVCMEKAEKMALSVADRNAKPLKKHANFKPKHIALCFPDLRPFNNHRMRIYGTLVQVVPLNNPRQNANNLESPMRWKARYAKYSYMKEG